MAIIIYGGGGHGKTIIELIRAARNYRIVGIVDDGLTKNDIVMNIPVLGDRERLQQLFANGIHLAANAVGGVGDIHSRLEVFQRLANIGFECPPLIHPTSNIEPSARLSAGVQVLSQAYVGSEAQIGFGVILNTGSIVSHGCIIGDYAHLSPGAILAGDVSVGEATLIGMGVTVNLGVSIGKNARIGNGATIKADVPDDGIVKAGSIFPS